METSGEQLLSEPSGAASAAAVRFEGSVAVTGGRGLSPSIAAGGAAAEATMAPSGVKRGKPVTAATVQLQPTSARSDKRANEEAELQQIISAAASGDVTRVKRRHDDEEMDQEGDNSHVALAADSGEGGMDEDGGGRVGDGANGGGAAGRKRRRKRRRRARRRRWKPYFKLTLEERRRQDEREERRAERVRAERFAHGLPVAPYNTTQFLLNDRAQRGGDATVSVDDIVDTIRHRRSTDGAGGSPGVGGAAGADERGGQSPDSSSATDYSLLEREFDLDYESMYAERLEKMTKVELVADYVALEKQLAAMRSELMNKNMHISELESRLSAATGGLSAGAGGDAGGTGSADAATTPFTSSTSTSTSTPTSAHTTNGQTVNGGQTSSDFEDDDDDDNEDEEEEEDDDDNEDEDAAARLSSEDGVAPTAAGAAAAAAFGM